MCLLPWCRCLIWSKGRPEMSWGLLRVSGSWGASGTVTMVEFFSWLVFTCVCGSSAIKRLREMGRKQPCLPLGQGSCFVLWADTNQAPALAAWDRQTSPQALLSILGALNLLIWGFCLFAFKEKNRTLIIICKGLDSHYRTTQVKLNYTVVTLLKILRTVCCHCPADHYFWASKCSKVPDGAVGASPDVYPLIWGGSEECSLMQAWQGQQQSCQHEQDVNLDLFFLF